MIDVTIPKRVRDRLDAIEQKRTDGWYDRDDDKPNSSSLNPTAAATGKSFWDNLRTGKLTPA